MKQKVKIIFIINDYLLVCFNLKPSFPLLFDLDIIFRAVTFSQILIFITSRCFII